MIADKPYLFNRTLKLKQAIEENDSFELTNIELWQSQQDDVFELINLVLTCDGVPDASKSGILYREALTIKVGNNSLVPEVWPSRADFPKILHMTVSPEHPPSLCLYTENDDAVNRNWTAQQFLSRIYWWIENSSKGTLHSDEQAIEQLFYRTKYELILPYNFTSIIQNDNIRLVADFVHQRDNGGFSLILSDENIQKDCTQTSFLEFKVFTVRSSPVKQDYILLPPYDVETLFALPRGIGDAVVNQLKHQIQALCCDNGAFDNPKLNTIILLIVPIYRNDERTVERYYKQAFLLNKSPYHLGLQAKFLFHSDDDKLYVDYQIAGGSHLCASSLGELKLLPMEVTKLNTNDEFAAQSNSQFSSDSFALVGLGALGSGLLDFWIRSGWGKWNLFDKDHIKPHNLTRHTANRNHIGMNKAAAALIQAQDILGHTDDINVFEEDALRLSQAAKSALMLSSLVIDASTSLDYPRKASFDDSVPRHMSVFVSPSGNDSVLLLEDNARTIRLRTIEAQYYRLIINEEWGYSHLKHHLGKFVSGGSCRDISLKLPLSSIARHSSTLADQIKILSSQEQAAIKVWQTNWETGETRAYSHEVYNEVFIKCGDKSIAYDQGLADKLYSIRDSGLPEETGGIVVGYVDFNLDTIFIVDVFGAPKDSVATNDTFKRGISGVKESLKKVNGRTANIVNYIGEWHSHPANTSAHQSKKDIVQLCEISETMACDGLPAIQIIVAENQINVTIGESCVEL
ncbi:ThiF family adenylyltransferase [Glaciecola sp. 2405UD65-10]|uniref:ThiF family adenylyltransferase n=1 Tax=Glaciecola sp. 2405UD65-10 TaxID=3397244 RepID=UPI003B59905E